MTMTTAAGVVPTLQMLYSAYAARERGEGRWVLVLSGSFFTQGIDHA